MKLFNFLDSLLTERLINMADSKLIIIHSDDTISKADYNGYESLQKAVGGLIEHFDSINIPVEPTMCNGKESLPVVMYCNDEFAVCNDEKFDKINAVAFLISETEIRGDVAIVVDAGYGESRGFEYKEYAVDGCEPEEDFCECWSVEDTLLAFINNRKKELEKIHKDFDNNKSKPHIEFSLE